MVGRTGSVHSVHNAKVGGRRVSRLTTELGEWRIIVKDRKLTGQTPDGQLNGVPRRR